MLVDVHVNRDSTDSRIQGCGEIRAQVELKIIELMDPTSYIPPEAARGIEHSVVTCKYHV